MAQYGVGANLASMGATEQQQGTQLLGKAADEEAQRNAKNTEIKAANKAGNQQLGATVGALGGFAAGAQIGAIGGPMGALIGGAVGMLASGLFN